ncbi:MAG: hypothetical protein IJE97_16325, partial [Thermoguttaceae bacterium]|nr:hypothetical protein [Thermoguttaceae bacterium]MBQ6828667.1 hypothetical protein [Thermoguttaceae bacterium]
MIYIPNNSHDPYFNLALEEFFLTRPDAAQSPVDVNANSNNWNELTFNPILLLWQNAPTVVVGGRQNTLEEINLPFIEERKINVVRRTTGGGAVYHDLGNLNYSFIVQDATRLSPANARRNKDDNPFSPNDLKRPTPQSLVCAPTLSDSFRLLSQPVVDVLRSWNLPAELSGRNDLTIDGRKISGAAQVRKNGRTLHHGTLLFDSNLDDVASALRVEPDKFRSKAVASVRSRVANIVDFLPETERRNALERFKIDLLARLQKTQRITIRELTLDEQAQIQKLRDEKYATWDWNFGVSPRFQFRSARRFDWGKFELAFDVVRGRVERAQIFGDFFALDDLSPLLSRFVGAPFERDALLARISEPFLQQLLPRLSLNDFIELALNAAPSQTANDASSNSP